MIDYSVFSQLAAARGSTISGPVSRSATAFNFFHSGPNSAYASFGYRQSGRWPFPSGDAAGGRIAMKVVNEFVHVTETPEEIAAEGEEPLLIEWREVRDGDGSGRR